MGDKCEISCNSAIEHNFPGPARLFQDKLDFSNVAEWTAECSDGKTKAVQNLESLITDPPPALLLHLKISDPDTLHSALDSPYTVIGKINV